MDPTQAAGPWRVRTSDQHLDRSVLRTQDAPYALVEMGHVLVCPYDDADQRIGPRTGKTVMHPASEA